MQLVNDFTDLFRWQIEEKTKTLYEIPDYDPGERIHRQRLHHSAETVGNLLQTPTYRTTGK